MGNTHDASRLSVLEAAAAETNAPTNGTGTSHHRARGQSAGWLNTFHASWLG